MKNSKKIIAGALACVVAAGSAVALVGCNGASSNNGSGEWVVKTDTAQINEGVYRLALFESYYAAQSDVEDTTKSVFDQKIDGEDATEWIKNNAVQNYLVPFIVVDQEMAARNLTLSDEVRYNAKQQAAEEWKQYGSYYEPYGIGVDDYQYITYDYSAKYSKIFESIYGEGGSEAVSNADLENYFKEHYYDFDYIEASTTKTDGSEMSESEIIALVKELQGYATNINAGKMTMAEACEAYNKAHELQKAEDVKTESLSDEEALAAEATKAIEVQHYTDSDSVFNSDATSTLYKDVAKVQQGKAAVINLAEDAGEIMLIYRLNNDDAVKTYLNKDGENYQDNRFNLLAAMKGADYSEMMTEKFTSFDMKSLQYNDKAYNVDLKALFEPDTTTSEASSAAATESKAAESTAESKAASAAESKAEASSAAASTDAKADESKAG